MLSALKAYIIYCFTNWMYLPLVAGVGLPTVPVPWPLLAGRHAAWLEAARLGPVGLADGPE